jgi:hypothetical protein
MRLSANLIETGQRTWLMFVEFTPMDGRTVSQKLAAALADELIETVVKESTPDNCEKEGEIESDGRRFQWRLAFDVADEDIDWERDGRWEPLPTDQVPCQWKQRASKVRRRAVRQTA